jgi:argininosuccinate lyase
MAIHRAHLVMLAAQRIITADDARRLREALELVAHEGVAAATFDGTCEDLFFFVERAIADACEPDLAGRLHTARSRNDIDMTMYRMVQRVLIVELLSATLNLRQVLLTLADTHRDTVFAVHTHTQRAQPSTVAHYLMAVVEQLERDALRLQGAFVRTNVSPLGSCAITGTGFPIDRHLTAQLLGFAGPTGNTYGSIASVDYLLESTSATAVLLVGFGRFVQDLLLWCTREFDYVRFGDGFVQCSSIMPQKRNPVAVEHVRSISSKALGQAQAILLTVHNTPFGDVVDTEDDLQPLVVSTFRDATRAVTLAAAAMATAEFDPPRLGARAAEGWTTLTELADTLVRDHGLTFRTAHAIAAQVMTRVEKDRARPPAALLGEASVELAGRALLYSDEALGDILSPAHFVAVRRTLGGPAPGETARAIASSRLQLESDQRWVQSVRDGLGEAERRLGDRIARL